MMIPLYRSYWDESDVEAVSASIRRGTHWAEGPNISEFEIYLIRYYGIPGALVCNSGTSALHLALMASGVKHFHEVIVPSFTFIATANAVRMIGATPVFADIEEQTYGLNPADVEKRITSKTKAIIAVHYAGHPCQIRELRQLAARRNLILIEDAAEALGASCNGMLVGKFGQVTALSFCANKVVATGEGGAVLTDDKYIYDRARLLRSHGREEGGVESGGQERYTSLGYNFRMSDMVAGLGCTQMAKSEKLIAMRRQVAQWYHEALKGISGLSLPHEAPHCRHVYQLYTIRIEGLNRRDKVHQHLTEKGIGSKVYFRPIHLTEFYRQNVWSPVSLPVTERISHEVLSLPMYPGLTQGEVSQVADAIKEVLC